MTEKSIHNVPYFLFKNVSENICILYLFFAKQIGLNVTSIQLHVQSTSFIGSVYG